MKWIIVKTGVWNSRVVEIFKFAFLLFNYIDIDSQVVQEYERAVIFRLGRLVSGGAKGPGNVEIHFIL